jgi:hypothetical protein
VGDELRVELIRERLGNDAIDHRAADVTACISDSKICSARRRRASSCGPAGAPAASAGGSGQGERPALVRERVGEPIVGAEL